jgi:hypothetical protein
MAVSESLLILRVATAAPGQQIVEGEAGQWPQVAVPFESNEVFILKLPLGTLTGHQSAEVRVPEGYVEAQPASSLAKWALIFSGCFFSKVIS